MTGETEVPIRFEWFDYAALPIAEGFSLPPDLERALAEWGDEGDQRLSFQEGHSDWLIDWTDRGRSLARKVSEALRRPVDYKNEATGGIERIALPEERLVHRHDRPPRG